MPEQERAASVEREWRIVFDLNGRDEDALVEAVERILCGPEHPNGDGICLVQWFSCTPPDDGEADD